MNYKMQADVVGDEVEDIATCGECGSLDIGEVQAGDEGWTVCQGCQTIEGGYKYITEAEAQRRGLL